MSSHPAILIVEDEPTLAKNMGRYLRNSGFDVKISFTGATAMSQLERYKPDIVLLDYRLPDTDGLELLGRMQVVDRRIRVIMITGEGNIQLAVQAIKAGADDYLEKPVVLKELKLLLNKIAGRERMQEALDYFHQKQAGESGLMLGAGLSWAANSKTNLRFEYVIRDEVDSLQFNYLYHL